MTCDINSRAMKTYEHIQPQTHATATVAWHRAQSEPKHGERHSQHQGTERYRRAKRQSNATSALTHKKQQHLRTLQIEKRLPWRLCCVTIAASAAVWRVQNLHHQLANQTKATIGTAARGQSSALRKRKVKVKTNSAQTRRATSLHLLFWQDKSLLHVKT
ncbi:hypothetical protein TRVL_08238 [Trypanosoma vivax]|nr:hypothetical protein TRVL_08238 [Trypanosoma vivax]